MNQTIERPSSLHGTVSLPADKSVSHRAAMLSALGEGTSRIHNFPQSADPQSTLACMQALGAVPSETDDGVLTVRGRGVNGLRPPSEPLDCGNSGTTMRLLAGILAGQKFGSVLTGDASLQNRPMQRIADPLCAMNARVHLRDGHAPIRIRASRSGLQAVEYRLPVASAQVKSCVLLAGLYANGTTTVIESTPARDHTERMLDLPVESVGGERLIRVEGGLSVPAQTWHIPGDFSGAAFFLVAGTIVADSELTLNGVGLNPSRTALLDVLRGMGADIRVHNERTEGGEPMGDLVVRAADLEGVDVGGRLIPNLIDEVPVLAVAAACAEGTTTIRDAAELRVKETDRLHAITENLRAMGATIDEHEDGLTIHGNGPSLMGGADVDSFDDHRIAMAMGVAALVAHGPTTIHHADCARISFPDFWTTLRGVMQ